MNKALLAVLKGAILTASPISADVFRHRIIGDGRAHFSGFEFKHVASTAGLIFLDSWFVGSIIFGVTVLLWWALTAKKERATGRLAWFGLAATFMQILFVVPSSGLRDLAKVSRPIEFSGLSLSQQYLFCAGFSAADENFGSENARRCREWLGPNYNQAANTRLDFVAAIQVDVALVTLAICFWLGWGLKVDQELSLLVIGCTCVTSVCLGFPVALSGIRDLPGRHFSLELKDVAGPETQRNTYFVYEQDEDNYYAFDDHAIPATLRISRYQDLGPVLDAKSLFLNRWSRD